MIDARTIARALGGEASGNTVRAPGPGHSRHDRSLSVKLDPYAPEGFVVHSFAGDDPLDCRDYVRAAIGLPGFKPRREVRVAPRPAPIEDDRKRITAALTIWRQAGNPAGTIVEHYLRSRGLRLEGEDIRFHASLRFEGRTVAGMVALMRDVLTNEPCGVHRTFLDAQGRKLDRKMLGRAKGACVKLSPDAEVTQGLGIAEGIETALSVMQAGFRPMWACLSAGAIAAFPVLPGVDCLTVFADHDKSGTGEQAARECLTRWMDAGREAVAISPAALGDFNDIPEVAA